MIVRFLRLALSLVFVTVPLLGATFSAAPNPIVVVYPLTVTGGATPEAGANIAVLFSTRLAEGGGLTVKPYTAGTQRADYLEAARALGADYYVTGYLTPLGDDISMLAQVVSCYSGTVVYSTTALVRTYAEAGGQSDILRAAILRHAGRQLAELDQPPPPSATPLPQNSEGPHELGGITSRIFHHKQAATPSPIPSPSPTPSPAVGSAAALGLATPVAPATPAPATPAPAFAPTATPASRRAAVRATPLPQVAAATPAPVTPSPATAAPVPPAAPALTSAPTGTGGASAMQTVASAGSTKGRPAAMVIRVTGDGESADQAHVASALAASLSRHGQVATLAPAGSVDPATGAAQLCSGSAAQLLYTATLSVQRDNTETPSSVGLAVVGYDCAGNAVIRETVKTSALGWGGYNGALDRAADAAAVALTKRPHAKFTAPAGRRASS